MATTGKEPDPRGGNSPRFHPREDLRAQVDARRADVERGLNEARAQFDQASKIIEERTGRNLIFAIPIGIAIGILVVASLIFFGWTFALLAAVLAALGSLELATALTTAERHVARIPAVVASIAIVLSACFLNSFAHWGVLTAALAFVVAWRLVEQAVSHPRVSGRALLHDLSAAIFVQTYVSLLGSFGARLVEPGTSDGQWWVLAFIIVAVTADTGAYVGGLLFGRHPMAPVISPKKTWEGFAGAAIVANIAGILLAWLMLHMPWWFGFIFGSVILITATLGDLAESLIKRDIGVKDMSGWLPGHGGVLDRLDSVLPSAVAAFALYFLFFPLLR